MHKLLIKNKALTVFFIFLVINLVQAIFTDLINDEAYYWLWSQYPQLGYNHPPLTALLIWLSKSMLPAEIGVRILFVLGGSFGGYLLTKIVEHETQNIENFKLFLLIISSSVFFNVYTFIAIPDTVLLFLSILFLRHYQRWLKEMDIANSILLGLITALLFYAKYHGVLFAGLVLISNVHLLKQRRFYLVFMSAILFYSPHLYWLFENNFGPIAFQLSKSNGGLEIKYIFSYVGEQLLLSGPFILILATILYKPGNNFQKSLKFYSLGIFIFFLVSSANRMINAYHTLLAWPGLFICTYLFLKDNKKVRKIGMPVFSVALLIIILLRINFVFNFYTIPHFNDRNPEYLTEQLNKKTNLNLVFLNTFIDPALYSFYSNKKSYAINNYEYRRTTYNSLSKLEKEFQDKDIVLVSSAPQSETYDSIVVPKGKKYYLTDFCGFKSYQTSWEIKILDLESGENNIRAKLQLHAKQQNVNMPEYIGFHLLNHDSRVLRSEYIKTESNTFQYKLEINNIDNNARYKCWASASPNENALFSTFNSKIVHLNF